jgi:hypothetical protein
VSWLDRQVETRRFASRSHAVEVLILAASRREQGVSGGSAAGFQVTREFSVNGPGEVDGSADLEHRFLKAAEEAWNTGSRIHVIKVTVKGQEEPQLFYRLKDLGTACDAHKTRQEYLAISGKGLQVVRLVIIATRGPNGMGASVEAEQTPLGPEEAKQFGMTHDQMVAVVERFLNGDLY